MDSVKEQCFIKRYYTNFQNHNASIQKQGPLRELQQRRFAEELESPSSDTILPFDEERCNGPKKCNSARFPKQTGCILARRKFFEYCVWTG